MQPKNFINHYPSEDFVNLNISAEEAAIPEPQSDCQLTWESQWEDVEPAKTHILVVGEAPFLKKIAIERIERYKIPTSQRFGLIKRNVQNLSDFQIPENGILEALRETDRLEIVGQLVEEKLLSFFRLGRKWACEFLDPSSLAHCLQHAGLSEIGTLYLMASQLGASNFLPSFARELLYRGIRYNVLCAPEGLVYSKEQTIKTGERKIRLLCKDKILPILPLPSTEQKVISDFADSVPVLHEGGPEFDYTIIAQVGEDTAVTEAAHILVGSSPHHTCWIKWFPSQGNWQVLYGEPRFLHFNTRWVVIAQSAANQTNGIADLFGGLSCEAFVIRFLRLLRAFEEWQEIHGKFSHLLLVGENLFMPENTVSGFASKLAEKFAALGSPIQIRARGFVHQKDLVGSLHAGFLTNGSPSLKWTLDSPVWERDLNWRMGQLTVVDAPVHEPEAPIRKPLASLFHAGQSPLAHLAWASGSIAAIHWRARICQAIEEIAPKPGTARFSPHLVPILEAAALSEEKNLIWINVNNGGVLRLGACPSCLREFENYFQHLSRDLFAAFLVDGDFYLQKRVGISTQIYETACRAAFSLFFLTRSETCNYFERALSVRLCSEFLKNLGEDTTDRQGILTRAWRGVSKNYANAELSIARHESATLSALSFIDQPDEYEKARAYQLSADFIRTSPPSLCWSDFLNPTSPAHKLLGNACECLSKQNIASDLGCEQGDAEPYFEKLVATQKNSVGTFQNTPEGLLWTPPTLAVVTEVDLRTPWICFNTHSLYSSNHTGKIQTQEGGMPFVQVDHADQLPCPVWSEMLSLDLWHLLGGAWREPLPMRPDILILPVLPRAHISYEWGPCNSEPDFTADSALKKLAQAGNFHPLYTELGHWHKIQKLHFEPEKTLIDIYLIPSTQQLIFPESRLKSYLHYRIHGAGGTYRCLVRKGFHAEIQCAESENWIFQTEDGTCLNVTEDSGTVEGEDISIRFSTFAPKKISICNPPLNKLPQELALPPAREHAEKAFSLNPHGLPGSWLGVFGNLHVRLERDGRLLRVFCSKSHRPLGLLKTIYAQTFRRFDRIGIHDDSCFAVEYLLFANQKPLQLTYRLNDSEWALIMVSTDNPSFFRALKATRQLKCPLDEFLLQWLDPGDTLWGKEQEQEGIWPHLAEFVLISSISQPYFSPLWVRTADNTVIWQGKCVSFEAGNNQMLLTTLKGREERFLFQHEGKVFFKNRGDTWMFPIHEGKQLRHLVKKDRWIISSQNIYSLTTIPLQIGWKISGSVTENILDTLSFGTPLHHPLLGVTLESKQGASQKMAFIDEAEKVAFSTPFRVGEKEGWFLGREISTGCACWWLPEDHQILCTPPHAITNIESDKIIDPPKIVSPPSLLTFTGAGITDGFLHIRTSKGDVYRKLAKDDTWQILQLACKGTSAGEIFCEIANTISLKDATISVLPLKLTTEKEAPCNGWLLHRTLQILKAPLEAGPKAILLGCSRDGIHHYVFGEKRIFEGNGSTWQSKGQASFALRKNNVLFLIVDFIADPPILDAEKLILLSSSQQTRWKLGEGLQSYQLIVVESCNGGPLSGTFDLQPLARSHCNCWMEGEDVLIAEVSTGHLLVIRNAKFPAENYFIGEIYFHFADSENYLSLEEIFNVPK